jgi:hypothetical protein
MSMRRFHRLLSEAGGSSDMTRDRGRCLFPLIATLTLTIFGGLGCGVRDEPVLASPDALSESKKLRGESHKGEAGPPQKPARARVSSVNAHTAARDGDVAPLPRRSNSGNSRNAFGE